ncbi:MAG: hypothetical protein CMO58_06035 [Verrucomicrobiales bacterium]|nr:hypothetical protein [Verrucomicrobiales bacterium]
MARELHDGLVHYLQLIKNNSAMRV